MSHIASISEMIVTDLDALDRAVTAMGGRLVRNATEFTWWQGQQKACDHRIEFPGATHSIGLVRTGDKMNECYTVEGDFGFGGLQQRVGSDGGLLKQRYGVELAREHYESQGFTLNLETKQDGTLIVTATREDSSESGSGGGGLNFV